MLEPRRQERDQERGSTALSKVGDSSLERGLNFTGRVLQERDEEKMSRQEIQSVRLLIKPPLSIIFVRDSLQCFFDCEFLVDYEGGREYIIIKEKERKVT